MTEEDKIAVIQGNVESLRKEMNSRVESDLKFGQTLIAGVAAVAILDRDIHAYLPVAPILALSLILFWQQSEFSLFRLGRRLMNDEARINELAGATLLNYESSLWAERKQWFAKLKWLRLVSYCLAAVLAFFLIHQLMKSSTRMRDGGPIEWGTYIVAFGIAAQIFNVFRRECNLFMADGS